VPGIEPCDPHPGTISGLRENRAEIDAVVIWDADGTLAA
jgi:hypothetical protein